MRDDPEFSILLFEYRLVFGAQSAIDRSVVDAREHTGQIARTGVLQNIKNHGRVLGGDRRRGHGSNEIFALLYAERGKTTLAAASLYIIFIGVLRRIVGARREREDPRRPVGDPQKRGLDLCRTAFEAVGQYSQSVVHAHDGLQPRQSSYVFLDVCRLLAAEYGERLRHMGVVEQFGDRILFPDRFLCVFFLMNDRPELFGGVQPTGLQFRFGILTGWLPFRPILTGLSEAIFIGLSHLAEAELQRFDRQIFGNCVEVIVSFDGHDLLAASDFKALLAVVIVKRACDDVTQTGTLEPLRAAYPISFCISAGAGFPESGRFSWQPQKLWFRPSIHTCSYRTSAVWRSNNP